MRRPATVTCDFCDGPIDGAKPWTTLNVVIPPRTPPPKFARRVGSEDGQPVL